MRVRAIRVYFVVAPISNPYWLLRRWFEWGAAAVLRRFAKESWGGVGQGTLFGAVEKRDIVINASLESVRTALSKGETPELLYEILPFADSSPDSTPSRLRLLYSRLAS